MTTINIEEGAINQLINEIRRGRIENSLWDTQDIADFLRLSKQGVQSHILRATGFPNSITLPSGGRRWVAKEVREWALRRR